MKNIEQKVEYFVNALLDVYRDKEERRLVEMPKLDLLEDMTEDFTAMLLAMDLVFYQMTKQDDSLTNDGLIDFTHILNKLAVRYIVNERRNTANEEASTEVEADGVQN